MSIYIKLATNEYPRHQGDIRLEYPDMGEEFVLPDTYAPVQWVAPPAHDEVNQRVQETAPELVDGQWFMRWTVRNATEQELANALLPLWELNK